MMSKLKTCRLRSPPLSPILVVCVSPAVAKATLAPFACTTVDGGLATMNADPSILCDGSGANGRMRAVGVVMLLLFVGGVPVGFATVLVHYRRSIQADQFLRVWGEGDTAMTNPNVHIRQRFRKLYEVLQTIDWIGVHGTN